MASPHPHEAARRATRADRDQIEALRAEAWAAVVDQRGGAAWLGRDQPAGHTRELLDAALDGTPDQLAVVGTLDDMVVGHGLVTVAEIQPGAPVARVIELWVTPQARGIGVGEAMMAAILDWAGERGAVEIDAVALPGDRATKNFFESHGLVARKITVSRRLDRGRPG